MGDTVMRAKYIVVAAALSFAACDSPLVTEPTASIDAETALDNARGIELALNGAYRSLQFGSREHVAYPDLYADNLDFTGTFQTDREFGLRNISPTNGSLTGAWANAYIGINRANSVLEGIPTAQGLAAEQAGRFRGEALFIRAMHYQNLVRWFGGVPLVLTPSKGVGPDALVERNTREEVHARIISDLEEAAPLLPSGRVDGKATRGAANALLARIYLEAGQHAQARDKATAVINSGHYSLVSDFRSLFTNKHTAESIYEVHYTINNGNSLAFWFFPQEEGGRWGFSPTAELYNLYGATDARRDASINITANKRYIFKYPRIGTEDDNLILLRLAEMYLIRAEANARLGAPAATVLEDINIVRTRAGAAPVVAAGQQALLDAVLHERRLELAFEGHRFFDLRRHNKAQQLLQLEPHRLILPLPQAELDVNPNLVQNPGY
jgi:starch-binding outer membrane protein, SusD/RagB family